MNQDPNDEVVREASKTGRPDKWDRDEMKPDFGDEPEAPSIDEEPDVPIWNEGQMARERPDGSRSPGPTDKDISSSKGGLSGGGANPGGGERWAERDVDRADD